LRIALFLLLLVTSFPTAFADKTATPVDSRISDSWDVLSPSPWTDQDKSCKELGKGESRGVDDSVEIGEMKMHRKFRVTRDKADGNVYHVDVPVEMYGDKSAIMAIFGTLMRLPPTYDEMQSAVWKKYIQIANDCFDRYAKSLRDEEGHQLHLRIVPHALDPATESQRVAIQADMERPNSSNWDAKIDCATIIHETLHLTGLSDRYQEKWLKITYTSGPPDERESRESTRWNCRASYPPSVMNNQWDVLNSTWDVVICFDKDRRNFKPTEFRVVKAGEALCPEGFSNSFSTPVSEDLISEWTEVYKNSKGWIVLLAPRPKAASLSKSELKFVTNPYCTRDNPYLKCAQNDYRTKELEGCSKPPEGCEGRP
jgi:hypothetical protein